MVQAGPSKDQNGPVAPKLLKIMEIIMVMQKMGEINDLIFKNNILAEKFTRCVTCVQFMSSEGAKAGPF